MRRASSVFMYDNNNYCNNKSYAPYEIEYIYNTSVYVKNSSWRVFSCRSTGEKKKKSNKKRHVKITRADKHSGFIICENSNNNNYYFVRRRSSIWHHIG